MADNITEKKLGIIEVKALRDANGLMEGNTHLKSVECPFPALTNGSNMFKDCINLTLFYCDDLSKLYNGTSMFEGCKELSSVIGTGGNPLNLSSLSNGTSMFHCTNISEFTADLPNLTDGTSMFMSSSITTFDSSLPIISTYNNMFAGCPLSTFKCKELGIRSSGKDFITASKLEDSKYYLISFNANMAYITNANEMFIDFTKLNNFEGDMPSLTDGSRMFYNSKLSSFNASLPKLTDGSEMFYNTFLSSFDVELPYLSIANSMFKDGDNLNSFTSDLPKLTDGSEMFYGTPLSSFDVELPYLSIANGMFRDCNSLNSFTSDLPKLTDGSEMFDSCDNLKTFKSNLESLSTYTNMFTGTTLNTFDGGDIGITDTGLYFIANSHLKDSKDTLTSFKGNLTKSTNTDEMFVGFNKLDTFEGDMNNVTSSKKMFKDCEQLQTFKSNNLEDLSDSTEMFYECYNLIEFDAPLPSLSNGNNMFYYTSISEFTTDLPSLTDGSGMFYDCDNLKTFKSKLEKLTTYTNMFMDTRLNTFNGYAIKISDTGSIFMSNSHLSDSKDTLTSFYCYLPNMTNTKNMFKDFNYLNYFESYMPEVTTTEYMFQNCTQLTDVKIYNLENLEDGSYMFYNCYNLVANNITIDYFTMSLSVGTSMFAKTNIDSIPWNFPELVYAHDMFAYGKFTALDIDSTIQFPKLNTTEMKKKYPGEPTNVGNYMFKSCKNLTSLRFDVSTIDYAECMFYECDSLTDCSKAIFANGGVYNNMFTHSKFNEASAQTIYNYAKMANVAGLHIGIGFQLTEDHDFVKSNNLYMYRTPEGNFYDNQWCYAYCASHSGGCSCPKETYKQDQRIIFVCNPN